MTTIKRLADRRHDIAHISEKRFDWLLGLALTGIFALLMTLEAVSDEDGESAVEFVFEALEFGLIIAIATGIVHLIHRMRMKDKERQTLVDDLEAAKARGNRWRNEAQQYINGFRSAMDGQFQEWGVSNAEKDVGLLILKGLSHKEIANVRGTSEATVRQQAQAIYEKSGLPGKAALLSFFLEDLFVAE